MATEIQPHILFFIESIRDISSDWQVGEHSARARATDSSSQRVRQLQNPESVEPFSCAAYMLNIETAMIPGSSYPEYYTW